MTERARKPSLFQIGKVTDDGYRIRIFGWGVGMCVSKCHCHRDPATGLLQIDQSSEPALLGLKSFKDSPCPCCEPWQAQELVAIVQALDDLKAMPTTTTTEMEGQA